MSTLYTQCASIESSYRRGFILSSREPSLWNSRVVTSEDANGNPLTVEYFYNEELVFYTIAEYNAQSKETSFQVYKP